MNFPGHSRPAWYDSQYYLMWLGHLFDTLSCYAERIAKVVRDTGCISEPVIHSEHDACLFRPASDSVVKSKVNIKCFVY